MTTWTFPFDAASKQKWDQKNKSNNPLSGKGKSYGKHVEQGWGQYVEPIHISDEDIGIF